MDAIPPTEPDSRFDAVLTYLKDTRGFDFTGYKRTSLARRIRLRMSQVAVAEFADYIDFLQVNTDEFDALFNTILINVTSFFRDKEAWEHLGSQVAPALLAERGPDAPIRIWSAGCASGQEAYSLAILLAEALGPEQFRARVKIYATDVDDQRGTPVHCGGSGDDERGVALHQRRAADDQRHPCMNAAPSLTTSTTSSNRY